MTKSKYANKGFVLVFSLILMLTIILSVSTYFEIAGSSLRISTKVADIKRAGYVADAGLADAFMQMRSAANLPAAFNIAPTNFTVGSQAGSYSVQVVTDGAVWPTYTITSTGIFNSQAKTLQLRVQPTSAAMFAYLSNSEIHPTLGTLWWITGMYTVGPVHTNGRLNIWGDPIFDGPVSQTGASINYWPGVITDPADFRGGLSLGVPAKAIFNNTILNNISAQASSGGLSLSGNSTIVFNADGTMNVTNNARRWNNVNMAAPANHAVYVNNGSATVRGTVNGQVTVGCNQSIYISNNLMYNSNPDPTHPNLLSNDLLALVAQNNITVQAASAPANVVIAAVMVAINGSFQVDNWWAPNKGNMLQYGALINNVCGPTGVFDPGTGTLYGGYNQLQYYDARLDPRPQAGRVSLVPPCFPPVRDQNNRICYTKISFQEP